MCIYAGVVAHEFGHCFGAFHAKFVDDMNRGSVDWCDWETKKNSPACNKDVARKGLEEYGSPHTSMWSKCHSPSAHTQRPSSAPVPPQGAPRCVVALGGVCTLYDALPEERGQPTLLCGRPVTALWVLEPAASTHSRAASSYRL